MFRLILNKSPVWFSFGRGKNKLSRSGEDLVTFSRVCEKTIITVIMVIFKQGIRFSSWCLVLDSQKCTKSQKLFRYWTYEWIPDNWGFIIIVLTAAGNHALNWVNSKLFRFSSTLNLISKQPNLLSPTVQPYSAVNAFTPERLQVGMHTCQIKAWFQHPTRGPKLQNQPPTSITQPPCTSYYTSRSSSGTLSCKATDTNRAAD